MPDFIIFLISATFIFFSAYCLTICARPKTPVNAIIYIALISIAHIILASEALSLFSKLNTLNFINFNFIFLLVSLVFWKYSKLPALKIRLLELGEIINALKKDKFLAIMAVFFLVSLLICLFLAIVAPTNNADSLAYRLSRIGFWIQNEKIFHYETTSIRQAVFSINSEILMLWSIMFLKGDHLAMFSELLSYLGSLFVVFNFLRYLKISVRRSLWVILILGSLPAMIVETQSVQSDLLMGFLLVSAFYLFVFGVRESDKSAIILSALGWGIAIGTKNTGFLFISPFIAAFTLIAIKELKKEFYKPLLVFVKAFLLFAFLLSSYWYILNFIDFGSPMGPVMTVSKHCADRSTVGIIAAMLRYMFIFLDFSGIPWVATITSSLIEAQNRLFNFLHLKNTFGVAVTMGDIQLVNTVVHENYSMLGIIGFLLFFPLVFICIFKHLRFNKDKSFYIALSALITGLFLVTISSFMGYSHWYTRFFTTAAIISSPVLVYCYRRRMNVAKFVIFLIVIYGYVIFPTMNRSRPFLYVIDQLREYKFSDFRNEFRFRHEQLPPVRYTEYYLVKYLLMTVPPGARIGLIFNEGDMYYHFFEEKIRWNLETIRYNLFLKRKNYNDYDYIIISDGKRQTLFYNQRGKTRFDYIIKGKMLVPKPHTDLRTVTVYSDKYGHIIDKGIPALMANTIDLKQIPRNFKLIKTFKAQAGKEYTDKYYVYKNMDRNFYTLR